MPRVTVGWQVPQSTGALATVQGCRLACRPTASRLRWTGVGAHRRAAGRSREDPALRGVCAQLRPARPPPRSWAETPAMDLTARQGAGGGREGREGGEGGAAGLAWGLYRRQAITSPRLQGKHNAGELTALWAGLWAGLVVAGCGPAAKHRCVCGRGFWSMALSTAGQREGWSEESQ